MTRPSEKALCIAEDLLDYVHPGMTRAAALHEVADMVDEMNSELVETVSALLVEVERTGPGPHATLFHHLRELLADYKPWHVATDHQHELFPSLTSTATKTVAVAGQMP
jgi:hypothetical protein